MSKFKFYVQPQFDSGFVGGIISGEQIHDWIKSKSMEMSDASAGEKDFALLSERLLLEGKKDFLIWDDVLKSAEMTFFADQTPLKGPSIDFCCGYGFWTSRVLGKIDIGVDLFPDGGSYSRSIEGFVDSNFIGEAYRSVLQADVTEKMPLPDGFFESVIAVCALEHIASVDKVLAEMVRILKPEGKIYLSLQTSRYIEKFKEIFNPAYVQWVRETFAIHQDRTWKEWDKLIRNAGLTIESHRFVLSEEETALKALMYWKDPFAPAAAELGLEHAVKAIPEFRRHYFDAVRLWSRREADPDQASIVCLVCSKIPGSSLNNPRKY